MTAAIPLDVPRRNGELVFDAPWESRAFGMVAAYLEATGRGWEVFRQRLVAAIAERPDAAYYIAWAAALERLLSEDDVVSAAELEARASAIS